MPRTVGTNGEWKAAKKLGGIYLEHNCGVLMFVPLDIKLLLALLSLSPKMVHLTAPWGWCVVYCAEFLHNPLSTLVRYNAMWIVLDFSVCIVLHCIAFHQGVVMYFLLDFITLKCFIVVDGQYVGCITLHCFQLYCNTLKQWKHCITRCIILHCIALWPDGQYVSWSHYFACHWNVLDYIVLCTLHCITLWTPQCRVWWARAVC